jgi:hypothetical protein
MDSFLTKPSGMETTAIAVILVISAYNWQFSLFAEAGEFRKVEKLGVQLKR